MAKLNKVQVGNLDLQTMVEIENLSKTGSNGALRYRLDAHLSGRGFTWGQIDHSIRRLQKAGRIVKGKFGYWKPAPVLVADAKNVTIDEHGITIPVVQK